MDLVIPLTWLIKKYTHSTLSGITNYQKIWIRRDTFSTKPGYNLNFNNSKGSHNPAVPRGHIFKYQLWPYWQSSEMLSDKNVLVIRTDLKSPQSSNAWLSHFCYWVSAPSSRTQRHPSFPYHKKGWPLHALYWFR